MRARVEMLEQRLMLAVTPVINEFMASNHNTIDDVDGDSSDWIEIYNPDVTNLNLDGYFLSDDAAIVAEPFLRATEDAAEGPLRIEIDPRHGDFLDAQAQPGRLHPELQRHAPGGLGDAQPLQRLYAVSFEPAKGVRQVQAQPLV